VIRSLRGRLTLSYVLVALLCVVLVSALANGVLEGSFRRYVSGNQESRNRRTVELLAAQVTADAWDRSGIESIGMDALAQGMIVKVKDDSGRTVWDATLHNNGLCEQMISHMEGKSLYWCHERVPVEPAVQRPFETMLRCCHGSRLLQCEGRSRRDRGS